MVIFMPLPIIHPIVLDSLTLLLVASLTESLSIEEQGVVGIFLSTMGDMLSLNSSYLLYIQSLQKNDDLSNEDEIKDEYDLLKKSFDKLEEELEKLKQDCCKHS